ncbi:MAG: NAD-dependent epimerase/dehydratase family protein [Solirubrobacteraceae bacterium]
MSEPILLTGGAGFIGTHVAEALLAAGHEVRIVDHLHPAAHAGPPAGVPEGADWRKVDLRDIDAMRAAVAGVGAVCHQAAMVGLGLDPLDVTEFVSHNDLGTAVLLRALAEAGWRGRIVLAGSMVVYGEGAYACAQHGPVRPAVRAVADLDAGRFEPPCPHCGAFLAPQMVDEDAPVDPRNVYAATKLHQEHLCAAFARELDGVELTVLRYHNVYGPRMPRDTPYAGVASIFRSALEQGHAPRVFEDGAQRRDFVHVRDVAGANLLALTGDARGTFNIASGEPRTVADMARALAAAAGPEAPAPVITGEYRRGDVRHVVADPGRARRELGFDAKVTFTSGVEEFSRAALREPAPAGRSAGVSGVLFPAP